MKCPDFGTLIEYVDGQLDEASSARVASHLASECSDCQHSRNWYERVKYIAENDDSLEPSPWVLKRALRIYDSKRSRPHLVERMGRRVATLLFDSFALPSVAGVRSTDTINRQLLFRAGEYSVDLQVAPSDQSRAELAGQILKEGESGFESVSGLAVELVRGDEVLHTATTNGMGEFHLGSVRHGGYDLRIRLPEGSLTIAGLDVTEPR